MLELEDFNQRVAEERCKRAIDLPRLTGPQFIYVISDIHRMGVTRLGFDPETAPKIELTPIVPDRPTIELSGVYNRGERKQPVISYVGVKLLDSSGYAERFYFEPPVNSDQITVSGYPNRYYSPILGEYIEINGTKETEIPYTPSNEVLRNIFGLVWGEFSIASIRYLPRTSKDDVLSCWDGFLGRLGREERVMTAGHLLQAIYDMTVSLNPDQWQDMDDTPLEDPSKEISISYRPHQPAQALSAYGSMPEEAYVSIREGEEYKLYLVKRVEGTFKTYDEKDEEVRFSSYILAKVLHTILQAFQASRVEQAPSATAN